MNCKDCDFQTQVNGRPSCGAPVILVDKDKAQFPCGIFTRDKKPENHSKQKEK